MSRSDDVRRRRGAGSASRQANAFQPKMELLEDRCVPSGLPGGPPGAGGTFKPPIEFFYPNGSNSPPQGAFTPAQIRHAYGIDKLNFSGVTGDGRGMTIAIVDAYDNPKFVSKGTAGFATSDLAKFDQQFKLPDPPSFLKLDQNGGTNYPGTDPSGGWEGEEALDVEWAHAIAPAANIILVECNGATTADLYTGIKTAARLKGVVVVSMSFGRGEQSTDTGDNAMFTTPAGHTPVTYLASTGDSGAPGGYPAFSPNVVAVGGTSLTTKDAAGTYGSESGWSGSGGGVSQFETQPAYQKGFVTQSSTKRATPDVSFVADPNTGVAVYDSFNDDGTGPWNQIGGTSLACPSWAAIIAIADQGRAQYGRAALDGVKDTLPILYSIAKNPATYKASFHDITTGNNGFAAGIGYDLVTGIGSPITGGGVPILAGPPNGGGGGGQNNPHPTIYYPLRYLYDPATRTYGGDLTLTNTGGGFVTGPATFVFNTLPPGVRLMNATGYRGASPYIKISFNPLGAGQSVRVHLIFSNPFNVNLPTFFQRWPVQLILG